MSFLRQTRSYDYEDSPCYYGLFNQQLDISQLPSIKLSTVFAGIDMISNSIATLPLDVIQYADNKKLKVDEHFVYHMFDNTVMTKFNTIKSLVSDLLLYGNGFAYIIRKGYNDVSLKYIPYNKVRIEYNEMTDDLWYYITFDKIDKKISPKDMIHVRDNTYDGVHGRGFLYYAENSLKLVKTTEKATQNFISNGCKLTGYLSTDSPRLDKIQRENMYKSLFDSNLGNGTRTAILEAGMKYNPVSVSSVDAQMLETREFNVLEISRFLHISPFKLGVSTGSHYGSIEQANIEYLQDAILPKVELLENEFDRKLGLEKNHYINFDVNVLLKADKHSEAITITTLTKGGVINVNEGRDMLGLNPIEGGNKIIVPYTDIESNTIAEQDKSSEDESK